LLALRAEARASGVRELVQTLVEPIIALIENPKKLGK
jgi:hypothetical protein